MKKHKNIVYFVKHLTYFIYCVQKCTLMYKNMQNTKKSLTFFLNVTQKSDFF